MINILLIDCSKVAENNKLLFNWNHCFTKSLTDNPQRLTIGVDDHWT